MILTPDTFIIYWEEFLDSQDTQFLEKYQNVKDRTCAIIGQPGSCCNDGSPLGTFLQKQFPNYDYRKEDGSIDISMSLKHQELKNVLDMQVEGEEKELPLGNYPAYYDVLIEHENKPELAYEEMAKLTYFNSNLKVLIVHLWMTEVGGDPYEYAHKRLANNFLNIIKQANTRFPENIEASYLLITVQKIGNSLVSQYAEFEVMSMIKQEFVTVGQTNIWKKNVKQF